MHSMKRLALLLLSLALALSGCRPEEPAGSAQFSVTLPQALASAQAVSRVTVIISGADMPSMSTELARTGSLWGGVISNIPTGSNRTFLARAFDSSNNAIFEGSTSGVTISANQTTLVAITLQRELIARFVEKSSPRCIPDPNLDIVLTRGHVRR
jgi:hypothetical protein